LVSTLVRAGIPGRERMGLVSTLVRGRYTWKGEEDGLVSTLVRAGIPGKE
jgi:hypothetical protein